MHSLLEVDGLLRQLAPFIPIRCVRSCAPHVASQSLAELCWWHVAYNFSAFEDVHDFPDELEGQGRQPTAGV